MAEISPLELDLLLLFYTFSDQHGKVDMDLCSAWAYAKMGVIIPFKQFTIEQKHLDALAKASILPDITEVIKQASSKP
jgi:hypothetical protein